MRKKDSLYLNLLEKSKTPPNFYCSQERKEKAGVVERIRGKYVFWEENNCIVCPPLERTTGIPIQTETPHWMKMVWADFEGWAMPGLTDFNFMDFEFIYDPKNFNDLSGGKWEIFRKNIRKFPNRYPEFDKVKYVPSFSLIKMMGKINLNAYIVDAFLGWLSTRPEEKIEDDATMLRFIKYGENRKILWDGEKVLGVNIWDENYMYVNFRYSFCRDIPYLSEYLRYLFYTDLEIQSKNKLVNDGGAVGNSKLENFKLKLNPVKVRKVNTWNKITEEE